MNTIQKLTKNIGILGVSQTIISILSFLLFIYIARYLGEAQFGNYSFAVSFTTLFSILLDIGMSQLIIREIARNKDTTSEYITNVSVIKILLSFITFGLIAITINLMRYPPDVIYIVYIFGIYTVLSSFAQMFMAIFQAFENMEYVALIMIIEKIIIIIFGFYVLFSGYGLIELSYVYILAGVIEVIISFIILLKKIAKPKAKINISIWKTLTLTSLPFGLNGIFSLLFFKIDTILLSFLQDEVAVGLYNAAYNPLLALGSLLSGIVISAIYPVMSRYYITSKDSLKNFTVITSKYLIIIGVPLAVGSFILADKIITLLYLNQYFGSIIAFQILALFLPIRLISSITGTLLTSIDKQRIRTFSVGLAMIFNILLNLVLIPSLSYVGASIATVLSEVILLFIYIYFINKNYAKLKLYNHFIKPMLASLIMGAVIFIFREINLFLIIVISSLSYFGVLILLKTFNDDKPLFKQIIGRN